MAHQERTVPPRMSAAWHAGETREFSSHPSFPTTPPASMQQTTLCLDGRSPPSWRSGRRGTTFRHTEKTAVDVPALQPRPASTGAALLKVCVVDPFRASDDSIPVGRSGDGPLRGGQSTPSESENQPQNEDDNPGAHEDVANQREAYPAQLHGEREPQNCADDKQQYSSTNAHDVFHSFGGCT